MTVLGMDVGERRVGIAISDSLGWNAHAYSVMPRSTVEKEFAYLKNICEKMEVTKIICGLPKNMDGTVGEKAEEVCKYSENMALLLGLPLEFMDERLTTVSAHRDLIAANMSRKKRKQVVDKVAATYILQTWLDRQANQKHL